MRSRKRWLVFPITLVAVLALGLPPSTADHATRQDVVNMEAVADLPNDFLHPGANPVNSDMAFWGDLAFQGNFEGFRIIDISDPTNPVELVDYEECGNPANLFGGGQGDMIIWEDLLIRTWDAPASAGAMCGGDPVPEGFEGLHLFDVSNPLNPVLVGDVNIGPNLPNVVTIDPPSSAAGDYLAAGAAFGPALDQTGISGDIELVDDGDDEGGTASVTDACQALVGFTPGNIALVDRGTCGFTVKVKNAQDAGATAVIVVNNVAGQPGTMGGADPTITIPSVQVSLADGNTIKAGLPASGTVAARAPQDVGCGAHTATGVPDLAENRLLVYVGGSNANCLGMDLVDIPLNDPAAAEWYGRANANRSCHDITVYLVDKMRAACSGSLSGQHGFTYFSMDDADGGSLEDPELMYERNIASTATIGHTTGFSWDGKYLYWSHEPGGGTQAQCQSSQPIENRQMWIFRAERGNELGRWTIPSQSAQENCASVHIMQSIPTVNDSLVLSTGTYQAGTYILDVTDPEFAHAIGWSDPPARVPTTLLAGAWATYWYNGFHYESDILFGLHIHRSTSPQAQTPVELPFLNPQTMMAFEVEEPPPPQATCRGEAATHVGTGGADTIVGTPGRDVIVGRGGNDVIRGRGGNDLICAGRGRDRVSGGAGNDRIFGQRGSDILRGGTGNDLLNGGPGRDICRGGPGNDRGVSCEEERGIER